MSASIKRYLVRTMYILGMALFVLSLFGCDAKAETYGAFHYEVNEDGMVAITGYMEDVEYLEIPAEINGMPVVSVRLDKTLRHELLYKSLKEITLPESVVKIDAAAFSYLFGLEKINGTEHIEMVEPGAFNGCAAIKELVFSNNLKTIGYGAFCNSNIEKVTFPDNVELGTGVFESTIALRKIVLLETDNPACVLKDGVLFSADLTELYCVPAQLTSTYVVPEHVTTIRNGAFSCQGYERGGLLDIYIGENVVTIEAEAINSTLHNDNPCLHVVEGSAAHQYAMNANRDYVLIGTDADVSIQQRIDQIIAEIISAGMSDYQKAKAVHDWICLNVEYYYGFDADDPDQYTARSALMDGKAICHGYTYAYKLMAEAAGLECLDVVNLRINHGWNLVRIDGNWVYVDCTWDDRGGSSLVYQYFCYDENINYFTHGGQRNDYGIRPDSLKYYPPYQQGAFDQALQDARTRIQSNLDAGTMTFSLNASAYENYAGGVADGVLATALYGETFTSNGVAYKLLTKPYYKELDANSWTSHVDCVLVTADTDLTDVPEEFEYSITTEGASILSYTGDSKVVVVPEKILGYPVVRIGDDAFSHNETIQEVQLPDTMKDIGRRAFAGCIRLEKVDLGSSLETIGDCAFSATPLTSITLPDTMTTLIGACFAGTKLTEIVIPAGITEISKQCFLGSTLSSIEFKGEITTIAKQAFCGTAIEEIVIPDSVVRIEEEAFTDCDQLKKVTIPSSVTYIGRDVFLGCDSLESVVTSAPESMFSFKNGIILQENGTYLSYVAPWMEELVVPDTVIEIADFVASGHPKLRKVTMGDNVTTVGRAFGSCLTLESIRFSDSITSFEWSPIAGCMNLMEVHLPVNLTYVGDAVICGKMSYFTLPPVKELKQIAVHLPNAKRVILSTGTETIRAEGIWAYNGEVWIPDSVTDIRDGAFMYHGENLVIVCNPDTAAETYALSAGIPCIRYPSLADEVVTLMVGQETALPINYDGLLEFEHMSCVSDNESVVVVSDGRLKAVKQGSATVTMEIEGISMSFTVVVEALDGLLLPANLEEIEEEAFAGIPCARVIVPESVRTIGARAFANCLELRQVVIPAAVTTIAEDAFAGCTGLIIVCEEGSAAYEYAAQNGFETLLKR